MRLSFDAFGKRRKELGWSGALPQGHWDAIAKTTRRGYTEDELVDNLTLTHMNGGDFADAERFLERLHGRGNGAGFKL